MVSDILIDEAKGLDDKYLEMLVEYIRFLQFESQKDNIINEEAKVYRTPRGLSEDLVLPDDFDETPDCLSHRLL